MTEGTPAQRLRLALEMSEFGVQMYRTRMRRMYPNASAADIDDKVTCWLLTTAAVSPLSATATAGSRSWANQGIERAGRMSREPGDHRSRSVWGAG
ncbi:hypothetical protein [Nocardia mangyaensis]|uniref:hypothetical protein n=1 Tax=Nocardia mangyaensis TaxID=2213200 RepID=UPI00345FD31A